MTDDGPFWLTELEDRELLTAFHAAGLLLPEERAAIEKQRQDMRDLTNAFYDQQYQAAQGLGNTLYQGPMDSFGALHGILGGLFGKRSP